MKKLGFILMAFALIMGASQCKKNDESNKPENNNELIFITLNVSGGTRANVVPEEDIAPVCYTEGDMIHVVSNGHYIGTLTYNGTNFSGDITNPTEGQPLHFYFLGNVTPTESLVVGETLSCSVIISDQTTSHPVISYAPSNQNYSEGTTNYIATLLNKCALVKFNVTTASDAATCIMGMNNKVTIDFATNEFAYNQEGDGVITLAAGNGEKWVILLPQNAMEAGEEGSAYSEDGNYTGTRDAIPAIIDNGYLINGVAVTINTPISGGAPTGAINGLFTINSNGDQVYFSQGNLQYQASSDTWRCAENQWDYIGENNNNISSTNNGWIDLFGWGTSGYNHGANCYQPWSTSLINSDYYAYGYYFYNLNDQNEKADWGYNPISNGNNINNQWHTLTQPEWDYVLNTRSTISNIRYAKANVNGKNGIILLPDDWNSGTYSLSNTNNSSATFSSNTMSASLWISLESVGAVFLPAAGYRIGSSMYVVGSCGCYWSASRNADDSAYLLDFNNGMYLLTSNSSSRCYGSSVRLVQDYNP